MQQFLKTRATRSAHRDIASAVFDSKCSSRTGQRLRNCPSTAIIQDQNNIYLQTPPTPAGAHGEQLSKESECVLHNRQHNSGIAR
ncbi:unnamed protein product, partial [Nesidiocoris tenuis]